MSMIGLARFALHIYGSRSDPLWLKLRSSATLPHILCGSDADIYRVYMQRKESLRVEFCRSRLQKKVLGFSGF